MLAVGTQTVQNTFSIPVASTVLLAANVFNAAGVYRIFDYSTATFSYAPFASPQALLDARLTIVPANPNFIASNPHGTVDTVKKVITVTLVPAP